MRQKTCIHVPYPIWRLAHPTTNLNKYAMHTLSSTVMEHSGHVGFCPRGSQRQVFSTKAQQVATVAAAAQASTVHLHFHLLIHFETCTMFLTGLRLENGFSIFLRTSFKPQKFSPIFTPNRDCFYVVVDLF